MVIIFRNSVECSGEIQDVERLKTWLSTSVCFFLDVGSYFAFHVCGSRLELEGKRDGSRVEGDYFHDHLRYHVGFGDVLDCRRSPGCMCMQHMLNVFLTRISRVSISGGDSPILLPCLESIGAGEGSELWTFEAAGALKTATGAKCVQVLTELNHTLDFPLYKQIDLSFLKSVISFIYAL